MSMFSIFGISGSSVSAQSQRLNVVASNLANADAVAGPDGQPYKARQVVFQTLAMDGETNAGVRVDDGMFERLGRDSDGPGAGLGTSPFSTMRVRFSPRAPKRR